MRRYAFYLTVALLAFGIGLFVVFQFYWKPNKKSLVVKKVETIETVENKNNKRFLEELTDIESFEDYKFVCKDDQLKHFLLDFLKERELGITSDVINCSKSLEVKQIDLNGDNKPEYIVGLWGAYSCGAKGNCPRIIYEQKGAEYKRLLFHKAALTFMPQKGKSNGYQNLKMIFNTAPYGAYVENYKFDGKQYKLKNCFDEWTDGSQEKIKCWNFE